MGRVPFFFLFFLLSGDPSFALPAANCIPFYQPLFGDQIAVFEPRTYSLIKNHPIQNLVKKLEAQNIPVIFGLPGKSVEERSNLAIGESIQEAILKRILKVIFPTADFITGRFDHKSLFSSEVTYFPDVLESELKPNAKLVPIWIRDSAEIGKPLNQRPDLLEMSLMKAASPLIYPISRASARKRYGVSASTRIGHLYLNRLNPFAEEAESMTDPSFASLISTIISQDPETNLFFLTLSSGPDFKRLMESHDIAAPLGFQVVSLSEVKNGKANLSNGKWIVYNDLRNEMPALYAASDYSVVKGAVNFFEPLSLGVPTILFSSPVILRKYLPEVYESMATTAVATHGAWRCGNLADLGTVLQKTRLLPGTIIGHPAFVVPPGESKSALENLLDRLAEIITLAIDQKL